MFTEILICSDGSTDALNAARFIAPLVRLWEGTPTVINVFPVLLTAPSSAGSGEVAPCIQALLEYGHKLQEDILCRTRAVLAEEGVPCRIRGEEGHAVHTIVRVAEEDNFDLIVLGSRGCSDIEGFLLGSVSHGVAHHAPCAVLVVRGETRPVHRIVAAFDGSEASIRAVLAGATLAKQCHVALTVLNVVEPGKPSVGITPQFAGIHAEDMDPAAPLLELEQTAMHRAEAELQEMGVEYRVCREQGYPAEVIMQFAEANQTDLIVMGCRGVGGFERLLLGSVSDAVLYHSPCPILLVR